ncbi:hypothetical protein LINPERHAP1_LOCUS11482 [Linum perenne]
MHPVTKLIVRVHVEVDLAFGLLILLGSVFYKSAIKPPLSFHGIWKRHEVLDDVNNQLVHKRRSNIEAIDAVVQVKTAEHPKTQSIDQKQSTDMKLIIWENGEIRKQTGEGRG